MVLLKNITLLLKQFVRKKFDLFCLAVGDVEKRFMTLTPARVGQLAKVVPLVVEKLGYDAATSRILNEVYDDGEIGILVVDRCVRVHFFHLETNLEIKQPLHMQRQRQKFDDIPLNCTDKYFFVCISVLGNICSAVKIFPGRYWHFVS